MIGPFGGQTRGWSTVHYCFIGSWNQSFLQIFDDIQTNALNLAHSRWSRMLLCL